MLMMLFLLFIFAVYAVFGIMGWLIRICFYFSPFAILYYLFMPRRCYRFGRRYYW